MFTHLPLEGKGRLVADHGFYGVLDEAYRTIEGDKATGDKGEELPPYLNFRGVYFVRFAYPTFSGVF